MALISILFITLFFFTLLLGYLLFFKPNSRLLILAVLFIVVFLALLGLTSYYSIIELDKVESYDELGPFGDYIGGVLNPLISVFAVFAAGFAFYAQYQANMQVQEQFKVQQFESQFFEMLRLHRANIDEMKIVGYEMITSTTVEEGTTGNPVSKTVTVSRQPRITEGRKVFVAMITELVACAEFIRLYNNNWSLKKDNQSILKLAYEFFFFGSKSEVVSSKVIEENYIKIIGYELDKVSDFHKKSAGDKNRFHGLNGDPIKLYIKYKPFSGHENRLGHYYRHLYSTVKYVVNKEKEGLINYKHAREYLKILRSQMSNDEQLMLYYNYIIGFGKDWENDGYLTKYRMLHNLPISRVKYTENPRVHFKDFIDSLKPEDGHLFEWGDL
ncbi:putative phage abortive infection protein [Flavobacterium sp. JLP]|uniref:putative phage abortive infection protein n=1 Tax=Flavobacterium sp. JLP TaxID=2783793 RepID=UPI00188A64CE|nr:putative phage abortive infection protein [Flavobacterium sp. JLP]MBF4505259.1 putative phage abortive infection protein [Flavobacterium sp. JLP]